jgi:hypothetical protein
MPISACASALLACALRCIWRRTCFHQRAARQLLTQDDAQMIALRRCGKAHPRAQIESGGFAGLCDQTQQIIIETGQEFITQISCAASRLAGFWVSARNAQLLRACFAAHVCLVF